MSELKPCPFCGSGYIDTGCLTVGCCRCGANGPEGYEGTTETWNDRPIEDALRAELDEQCRLNGMGGSREAKLLAEVERLKAELAKYTEPLRPQVAAFAAAMEATLKANDHKGGWADAHYNWLRHRLVDEVNELIVEASRGDYAGMMREAVDVANFAMMIYDVAAIRAAREGAL